MRLELPLLVAGLASFTSATWTVSGFTKNNCAEDSSVWAVGDNNDSGVNKCVKIDSSDDITGIEIDHDDGIAEIKVFTGSSCIGANQVHIEGPGRCAAAFRSPAKTHFFTHYFVKTK